MVTHLLIGFLAPVNSPPPKRQRTEQAREEIDQQTSNRGIIMLTLFTCIAISESMVML